MEELSISKQTIYLTEENGCMHNYTIPILYLHMFVFKPKIKYFENVKYKLCPVFLGKNKANNIIGQKIIIALESMHGP